MPSELRQMVLVANKTATTTRAVTTQPIMAVRARLLRSRRAAAGAAGGTSTTWGLLMEKLPWRGPAAATGW